MVRNFGTAYFENIIQHIGVDPEERYSSLPRLIADILSQAAKDEKDTCDSMLGWEAPETGKPPRVLQRAEASTLLSILYDDRHSLLGLGSTRLLAPGFEPLVFMLWRYTVLTR